MSTKLTDLRFHVGANQPTTVYLSDADLPWDPAVADVSLWVKDAVDPVAVARLFAASPRLLAALKGLLAAIGQPVDTIEEGEAVHGAVMAWEDIASEAISAAEVPA